MNVFIYVKFVAISKTSGVFPTTKKLKIIILLLPKYKLEINETYKNYDIIYF